MGTKTKILLALTALLALAMLTFFLVPPSSADSGSNTQNINCDMRGNQGGCTFSGWTHWFSSFPYQQAWKGDWNLHCDGHGAFGGSGGKCGLDVCLSQDGFLFNDDDSCWNIVSTNGNGNVGDGGRSWSDSNNIGGDYDRALRAFVAGFYANDATWTGTITVHGRKVSIDRFDAPTTVNTGNNFTVSWETSFPKFGHQDTVLLFIGGAAVQGDMLNLGEDGSVQLTASNNPGTINLTLKACGPSGSGVFCEEQDRTIDVVQSSICGNRVIEGTEQCDNGNANGACPAACSSICTTNSCGGGSVSCSPSSQSSSVGSSVSFAASGGSGAYSWSAPGGSPSSGGNSSNFSTSYSSANNYTVTVTRGSSSDTCSVNVGGLPPPPPPPGVPAVNITCSPGTIPYNSPANVSWSSNTTSCTIDKVLSPPCSGACTSYSASTGNLISTTTYTVTCDGGFAVQTFTSSGTFTTSGGSVEYLVVGGAGGGGSGVGGGGGAGGFRTGTFNMSNGSYPVVVGAGGSGGISHSAGGNGGDSSVVGPGINVVSTGGGGGGGWISNGISGGSGGGAGGGAGSNNVGGSGTAGQGNGGGNSVSAAAGGGGGGAGAVGGNPFSSGNGGGSGGSGLSSSISGGSVTYAGGGGGGGSGAGPGVGGAGGGGAGSQGCPGPAGTAGSANSGGGGGGGSACVGAGGSGGSGIVILKYPAVVSASCTVNVNPPVTPTASNVIITQPNYCVSGPAATVSWTYSDPAGSPQSAYQVQVDAEGASFQNPDWDSGKILCENCRSNSVPQGILEFNKTYRARVRAWNQLDIVSSWAESGSWKTPQFAFPQVNFIFASVNPGQQQLIPNNPVQFDSSQTQFFDSNPNGRRWDWNFDDGGTSTLQNPQHTFIDERIYNVTLTATDNQNQSCPITKPVNIKLPNPIWKEVNPGG